MVMRLVVIPRLLSLELIVLNSFLNLFEILVKRVEGKLRGIVDLFDSRKLFQGFGGGLGGQKYIVLLV